jgi:DNA-nicking Smr family endonuclease
VRSLSADEAALWAKVTDTIRPLSREAVAKPPNPIAESDASQPEPAPPPAKAPVARPIAQQTSRPVPGTTLDGTWDRKLRSGDIRPDRTLDLHGMSLDQAWTAIDRAIEQSIAAGNRVLLLITGHAPRGAPPIQRGRIRAAVHDWLAVSRHASRIAAVRNAHPRHGGGGSLYIILRRG